MTAPKGARAVNRHGTELPPGYVLEEGVPCTADYLRLRRISGLTPRSAAAADAGLPNTLFAVTVRYDATTVAMGRMIGDGALFIHIVDVAVDPGHQGAGLGTAVMRAPLAHIDGTVPAEVYLSLIANGEAYRLYEKLGFSSVMPQARGMDRWAGKVA